MNNKYIYTLLLGATMMYSTTSCVDMDPVLGGSTVTGDQKQEVAYNDPQKVEASVNAVFTQFSVFQGAIKSTVRHSDYGYGSIMLMMDMDGDEMVSSNTGYNWYTGSLIYDNREFESYDTQIVWNTIYAQIYAANNLVQTLGLEPEDGLAQYYLAQGLAVRAFDYWVLASLYQFNYVGNETKLCVPLLTEQNALDAAVNGMARSTVEEVYTQILNDLDLAISLLETSGESRPDNRYISKEVALGIRARVHMSMGKYAEALKDAQAAQAGATVKTLEEVGKPTFNKLNQFLWAVAIAETDDVVTTGIINWPSHMGSFNYGYNWYSGGIRISKKMFDAIPDTDIRKGWFLDENTESANLNENQQAMMKAYHGPYVQVKFAPYNDELETSTNACPVPLMRVEEMYLIEAEAMAMSGDVAGAKVKLENFVKTYRNPEYVLEATTAEDIQEEVFNQTRLEFWGEGLTWFNRMRLNKGIDRRGAGYPDATSVLKIDPKDPILLWRLPESEIQGNPMLSNADNNEVTPRPTPVPDL